VSYAPRVERAGRIDLVAVGRAEEALALRAALEELGAGDVRLHRIGRGADLAPLLDGTTPVAHLLVSCHGTEDGIVLPELAPELQAAEPFGSHLGAADIERIAALDGAVVVLTGCETGRLAGSLLARGAAAVVAPDGFPRSAAAFAFCGALYYALLELGLTLAEAVERARALGGDAAGFGLHTSPQSYPPVDKQGVE
jgi:hypothetical protein